MKITSTEGLDRWLHIYAAVVGGSQLKLFSTDADIAIIVRRAATFADQGLELAAERFSEIMKAKANKEQHSCKHPFVG